MESWPRPAVPQLEGEAAPVRLFDTAADAVLPLEADADGRVRLYVCGITPYDATHLGHAATYLAFDTLIRALSQAGVEVEYAQNVTDVDDPLLERAAKTGVDWEDLAESQTDLFRGDMAALRVIPPNAYVRVKDIVDEIAEAVDRLVADGFGYAVPTNDADGDDIYFDVAAVQATGRYGLGEMSHFSPDKLASAFVEFGGDPDRPGKRSPFDPLLWRAHREGEPSWDAGVGAGRPGWHVECAVIATSELGPQVTVQAGGRDLRFPHHEMTCAHATALTGEPFARHFAHAGLVGYEGTKMSKSLGNLVLVSKLTQAGRDAAAVRLTVLGHHRRSDWEWFEGELCENEARLERWREAAGRATSGGAETVSEMRARIADDLDTAGAIAAVDAWAAEATPGMEVVAAVDALLGIDLLAS
ncbi:cysteine--1-D-myo-inosityl 2-amino-2-deoxy-alpha-D-glucopyranoside ligase [Gulosibacter massiliensis]|uniref:cysteine--1-D-myo-inosityl 2-amino-2-deoxy-alpha-D-glucopyranoside ligase n=1 Tax=Gulosibacter massiliensis TaxID=2479839 RepID=UPI000F640512|nr:cysteine--1-D-myo-inosityl 2-amino-2-deoxy-alpha-D-glucopyranoside ligase [Gulosibacter massiliensis]